MMPISHLKPKLILLALAVAAMSSSAQDKGTGKVEKRAVEESQGEAASGEADGPGLQIGKLLPLNKPNLRVRIPGFDKGELASMVEAEKLTRIDDLHLQLEDATIQLIPQELSIRLRSALYNTEGGLLSSSESTTVSSKEFTMTGANMDFDTRSGKGRMGGPVRMIIHKVDAMGGADKKPAPQPTSAPAITITHPEETSKK